MPTRSIPWLRVFIEGVGIVGSILLAFSGFRRGWEGRQERHDRLPFVRLESGDSCGERTGGFSQESLRGILEVVEAMR